MNMHITLPKLGFNPDSILSKKIGSVNFLYLISLKADLEHVFSLKVLPFVAKLC
jgi:hypothetical protein